MFHINCTGKCANAQTKGKAIFPDAPAYGGGSEGKSGRLERIGTAINKERDACAGGSCNLLKMYRGDAIAALLKYVVVVSMDGQLGGELCAR